MAASQRSLFSLFALHIGWLDRGIMTALALDGGFAQVHTVPLITKDSTSCGANVSKSFSIGYYRRCSRNLID